MHRDAISVLEYVNPYQGTDSHSEFSNGNTLPLISRPFAMTSWSPQTGNGRWFFEHRERKLQGLRACRQPSPWIGDYGQFTLMPQSGALLPEAGQRATHYERRQCKPHYFSTYLVRYQVSCELTPTQTCAVLRIQYPTQSDCRLILETGEGQGKVSIDPSSGTLSGYSRANRGGVPDNFAGFFYLQFDCPVSGQGCFSGDEIYEGMKEAEGHGVGAYVTFDMSRQAAADNTVLVKVGTSFISVEQAKHNLEMEIGNADFDLVMQEAESEWRSLLERVRIDDSLITNSQHHSEETTQHHCSDTTGVEASNRPLSLKDQEVLKLDEQLRTFYTSLYRTLLFPRCWKEHGPEGQPVHYSPYDGQVHEGVLCVDNGFWDTHRTVYPLLALLYPEYLEKILRGWVQTCKEGGWFPKWASPGYRNCMIGTHIDAVIADAVVKGIGGFDLETAYAGLRKNAFELGDSKGYYGRLGLSDYIDLGYVPADKIPHAASRTQDFAYNDFCVAQVAKALGHEADYHVLMTRALNYRNTFDFETGFMRGRNADGSWQEPFDPFDWGGAYIEGSAWQCTWAVPHDPAGLIALMGGPEAMVKKLDMMLATPPFFNIGTYIREIHEMTEMASADFGQYAHSNQPVHHVLHLYACAGVPSKMQYYVHKVMNEMYAATPDGLSGDEDNGEMSAWYVFNALGLYPLCPGDATYVLVSPLFQKAVIQVPGRKKLLIEGNKKDCNPYQVKAVYWNNTPHTLCYIAHDMLVTGGVLRFEFNEDRLEVDQETMTNNTHIPECTLEQLPRSISPYR